MHTNQRHHKHLYLNAILCKLQMAYSKKSAVKYDNVYEKGNNIMNKSFEDYLLKLPLCC